MRPASRGEIWAAEGFEDGGGVFVGERIGGDAGLVVLQLVDGMRLESGRSGVEAMPGVVGSPG